jgi:sugar lactone lactonase YvrE
MSLASGLECVLDSRSELAEGPVWDPVSSVLYWVNIKAREIHRFDPASGKDILWKTPSDVGSLALREMGGLVVALKTGFFLFHPPGAFTPIAEPEPGLPDNRFNDGKTDRQGRFWAGSLYDPDETKPTGALFRLDRDLSCHRMVDGIFASNGLAFSPDSRTMYYADSRRRTVWAWDFDADVGAIANRRVFVELSGAEGVPDGAAVDDEGCYWLTQPPAARVVRYTPKGRIDRVLEMPVSQPTCVAFGGPRMTTLYITTASYRMPAAKRAEEPLAGSLFALEVGVSGPADARFGG